MCYELPDDELHLTGWGGAEEVIPEKFHGEFTFELGLERTSVNPVLTREAVEVSPREEYKAID